MVAKFNWFVGAICLLLLSSCLREKVVIENLQPNYPFSASCFLEKENPNGIRVKVLRTRKVFGPDNFDSVAILDAQVFMSNGQEELQLFFNDIDQVYQTFPQPEFFVDDADYSLRIKWRDYPEAKGKIKLPHLYEVPELEMQGDIQTYTLINAPGPQYKISLRFPDQAGQRNYYRILPLIGYTVPNQPQADTFYMPIYSNSIPMLSDEGKDGQELAWSFSSTNVYPLEGMQVVGLKLGVLNIDRNYFNFHKAFDAANSGEDLVEPYFVPLSFSNAYGVFAGSQGYSEKTFFLK
ncbi:MAG: DUF4249 domain-containing protein [Bacteroidetes bacterium]|nr:DUF4249 domain-containing protein [Bacteroidota bacterium]